MKIFFGDNQFLGVNHSDGKGSEYLEKYKTAEQIATTLRDAWDTGIKDFCFTVDKKTIDASTITITKSLKISMNFIFSISEFLVGI